MKVLILLAAILWAGCVGRAPTAPETSKPAGVPVLVVFEKSGPIAGTYENAEIFSGGVAVGSVPVNDSAFLSAPAGSVLRCRYRSRMAPGGVYHVDSVAVDSGMRWKI